MHTYTFEAAPGAYGNVMVHLDALDIVVASVVLADGVYTVTTAAPIDVEQLEHLSMTEVA